MAIPVPAMAMHNPAAAYCVALGYQYKITKTDAGELGQCVLPDGKTVDAWRFLRGEVASDQNYCARKGYVQKVVKDPRKCQRLMTETCLVCFAARGAEGGRATGKGDEVTGLMGLALEETTCGDGVCGAPENHKSCPKDCPSGGADGYCDGVKDGKCDPDCAPGKDPDCPAPVDRATPVGPPRP